MKFVAEEVFTFKGAGDATIEPAVQDAIKAVHLPP
jgi:hypothetical protein